MNISKQLFRLTTKTLTIPACRPRFANDFQSFSAKAIVSKDRENLEVIVDNVVERFPLVWLRDNCRCDNCFHKQSSSRIINWDDFNIDVQVKSIEVSVVELKVGQ